MADKDAAAVKPIGLTDEEAKEKIQEFGKNEFLTFKEPNLFEIFASQFQIQMLILIGAGVLLTFSNMLLAVTVFIFILAMVLIETWREISVMAAIDRIRTPYYGSTVVIRNGLTKRIPINMVAPRDIILLKEGMFVPADGNILKATDCTVDESIFGRDILAKKPEKEVTKTFQKQEDPTEILAGTFIATGECIMRVRATGAATKYSKFLGIESVRKKEMVDSVVKVSNSLKPVVLIISLVIFMLLLYSTNKFIDSVAIAAAVAVAGIPNTIAAIANSLFFFTLDRISKKIAVRNERLVDGLRNTTIICSEKVKTLTIGRPTISRMWIDETDVEVTGGGWRSVGSFKGLNTFDTLDKLTKYIIAATEADAEFADGKMDITGDPTEGAFVVLGMKNRQSIETVRSEYYCWRKETDPDTSVVTAVCGKPERAKLYVIYGPAQEVLKKSTVLFSKGKFSKIDDKLRAEIDNKVAEIAADGYDAWAVAYTEKRKGQPRGYALLGLVGMYDPPREDIKELVKEASATGVRFIVVAEEPTPTAISFARELGLLKAGMRAVVCDELRYMRQVQLRKTILSTSVFAEATPDLEKMIIEELQAAGQTVTFIEALGMDPKAINAADVSIVLESAADKLKYNADGILKNDELSQVPHAIEESKALAKGIERSFYALFTSDLSIMLAVFLSVIAVGKVLTVPQILLVNFIADGMIGLALAFENVGLNEIKDEKNKKYKEKFPSMKEFTFVFLLAVYLAAVSQFVVSLPIAKDAEISMIFAMLTMSFITITLSFVSMRESIINTILHPSLRIIAAIALVLAALYMIIHYAPLSQLFELKALSFAQWQVVGLVALSVVAITEVKKLIFR